MSNETDYQALIARVRKIDPEAADYLSGPARKLFDFEPDGDLFNVFSWNKTPQKGSYWNNIYTSLQAEANQ